MEDLPLLCQTRCLTTQNPDPGIETFERSLTAIREDRDGIPDWSPFEWRLNALNRQFGAWSEARAQQQAGELEARLDTFARQLSRHLSVGGFRERPLTARELLQQARRDGFRLREARQVLTEMQSLTHWHLYNKYERETLYLTRGLKSRHDMTTILDRFHPMGFPASTPSKFRVAYDFAQRTGTVVIMEVPIDEILYTYEISPMIQQRFDEYEFILAPNAWPDVIDANVASELQMRYNGIDQAPTRK